MLIDLHAHTSGISPCCRIDYEKVIDTAIEKGIDGIVLTNHYQKSYMGEISETEFIKNYIREYELTRKAAEKKNFRVFFGVEVTMEKYPNVHMLIFGVEPSFLEENEGICDLTQEELYSLVKTYDGILVQAHPFRNGCTVLDTKFLDGVEINCHPLYKNSYREELISIAIENNLRITSGGDFHADTYRPKCGMYMPDDIRGEKALKNYICTAEKITICHHEPDAECAVDMEFEVK